MDFRKLMYIAIIAICISSIGIGIYEQIGKNKVSSNKASNSTTSENTYEGKTQEELKTTFNSMFNNKADVEKYDTKSITKLNSAENIVYTVYTLNEKKDNYEVNLNFPVINIKSDITNKFNTITQDEFANKANNIISGNSNVYTLYNVDYTGYINGDILSVIVKSTLKEGDSAQRIMIETYNYNLKTDKEVTIGDVIAQRGISVDDVTKKINTQIKEAIKEANDIQVTGYEVYNRNIDDDMYKVENTQNYFLSGDGALYIIYAYGNNQFTSEMDVIVI